MAGCVFSVTAALRSGSISLIFVRISLNLPQVTTTDQAKTSIIVETCSIFQWISYGAACRKVTKKIHVHPRPSTNYDFSWDVLQIQRLSCAGACWRYGYIHPGKSKDMILDVFLWRSMLNTMITSIQHYLRTAIIPDVLQFLMTCLWCSMLKVWIHLSRTI